MNVLTEHILDLGTMPTTAATAVLGTAGKFIPAAICLAWSLAIHRRRRQLA